MSEDELALQDAGRDLRPDAITLDPDATALAVADLNAAEFEAEVAAESDAQIAESASTESETSPALESSSDEQAATDESLKDEKQ